MLAFGGQTALNLGVQVRTSTLQRRPFPIKIVVKGKMGLGRTFLQTCLPAPSSFSGSR